ncbi:hypothetical protein [Streptomyces sp. NPDC021020]|uniref:hypothetical protein n=1 Tax=Streptomyces sp. NPDC021020 TaxID=3365109 RepID=UPI0037A0FC06
MSIQESAMRQPSRGALALAISALVALGAAAYLAVALLGGGSGHHTPDARSGGDSGEPPPLGAHGAGVQRLTVQRWFDTGHPLHATERADGAKVGLGAAKPTADTPPDALDVSLFQAAPRQLVHRSVRTGDTFTALGIRVTVLKVWRMPNPAHDALDVRVSPA